MKKVFHFLAPILVLALPIVLIYVLETISPTPPLTKTTWNGQPAWGQIHSNGWYTFYYRGANDILGPQIASFPQGEALYLH